MARSRFRPASPSSEGEHLVRILFQGRRASARTQSRSPSSRSPTLADIVAFGVNIALAALWVGPFRGGGIALALTIASAVNTALLLLFLARNPHIDVKAALAAALLYGARLLVYSAIAAIPVFFAAPRLAAICAGKGRLLENGIPLAVSAALFGSIGLALLLLFRDPQLRALLSLFRRRAGGTSK